MITLFAYSLGSVSQSKVTKAVYIMPLEYKAMKSNHPQIHVLRSLSHFISLAHYSGRLTRSEIEDYL